MRNAGGTGYYRVSYSREQLAQLLSTPPGTLSTQERLALLADVKAAVDRGDVPLGEAMNHAKARRVWVDPRWASTRLIVITRRAAS